MLRERGYPFGGFEGGLHGTAPVGAGLSFSAALVVPTMTALEEFFDFRLGGPDGARLAQQVEGRFAGVRCGIMDPLVSRLGRGDHALFIDCRSLDHAHIPLPEHGVRIVVIDSRMSRVLAASSYNERKAECVSILRDTDRGLTALRDVSPEMLAANLVGGTAGRLAV